MDRPIPLAGEIGAGEWRRLEFVVFDFDGVFTDNTVLVGEDGRESVRCWRSDGLGLRRLRQVSVGCLIVSTETNPVVSVRARKLGIECLQAVEDKAAAITAYCGARGIGLKQVAYLGNDINDIAAFGIVGLPVAVADAYEEVLPHVRCRTARPGGRGAVRELCDLVFSARQPDKES